MGYGQLMIVTVGPMLNLNEFDILLLPFQPIGVQKDRKLLS